MRLILILNYITFFSFCKICFIKLLFSETSNFTPEQADNDNSDESESEEEEEDESEESEAESDDSDFAPKSKAKKNKDKKKAADLPKKSNTKVNKLTSRKQAQASNKSGLISHTLLL